MLVGERMSKPVISINPEVTIVDALNLMKAEHIRRTPIIKDGKLIGIVSDKDLLNASPSPATSLSIWEINYLIGKITVEEVMTKNIMTVTEDTPIEQAARIMADNKIGGLPVMRNGNLVGIITETDIFKLFTELMGARAIGVRITALIDDIPGQLAKLTESIAQKNGSFVSFGQFTGNDPNTKLITFKVKGLNKNEINEIVGPNVRKLIDVRA